MLLNAAMGLLPGMLSIFTVKKRESAKETMGEYGKISIPVIVCFLFFNMLCFALLPYRSILPVLSLFSICWMLTTTSYMDERSGTFHVYIPIYTILWNGVLLMIGCFLYRYPISKIDMITILMTCFVFLILKGKAFSNGDFYIFCAILEYFFLLEFQLFIIFVCVLLFCSSFFFVLRNSFRFQKSMSQRMPFTLYIAIGFFITQAFYYVLMR